MDLLLEAYDEAREVGRDIWDFAIQYRDLTMAGTSDNDLRKLIHAKHVDHAKPEVHIGMGVTLRMLRDFHKSCFVLTDEGASHIVAKRLHDDRLAKCRSQRNSAALLVLLDAYNAAKDVDQDVWEFAVPISALYDAGATTTILKRFCVDSLVDYACESDSQSAIGRVFQRPFGHAQGPLMFFENTCFVLTEAGVTVARKAQEKQSA